MEAQLLAGPTAITTILPEFPSALPGLWRSIADHLWQSTLFVLVLVPAALLLKRAPARFRYFLSLVASLKFALPAALLLPLLLRLVPTTSSDRLLEMTSLSLMVNDWLARLPALGGIEAALGGIPGLALAATVVWLLGAGAAMAHWWRRTRAFARNVELGLEVTSGPLFERFGELRAQLSLRRPVRLVLMRDDSEPGAFGVLRPAVVLPAAMPDRLSAPELEAVLLHELTHIARRDNLVASLHMGLCAIFWFFPLIWWLDRRLLAEREEACDEQVLAAGGVAKVYARGLLKAAGLGVGHPLAGVSTASASNFRLRIERILAMTRQPRVSWSHRLALASALPMLVLFSLLAGQPSVEEQAVQVVASAEPAVARVASDPSAPMPGKACSSERDRPTTGPPPGESKVASGPARPARPVARGNKPSAPTPRESVVVADKRPWGERRQPTRHTGAEVEETRAVAEPMPLTAPALPSESSLFERH